MFNDTQIGEIYETKNYDKFSYLKSNRPINQMRVNNIKNSIDQIGQVEPIMVDEAFKIIDGQHRFEACMALEKQVNLSKLIWPLELFFQESHSPHLAFHRGGNVQHSELHQVI